MENNEYIKRQLIEVLQASHEVGFRESNYPDDELIALLENIADELGIDPSEYNNDSE